MSLQILEMVPNNSYQFGEYNCEGFWPCVVPSEEKAPLPKTHLTKLSQDYAENVTEYEQRLSDFLVGALPRYRPIVKSFLNKNKYLKAMEY